MTGSAKLTESDASDRPKFALGSGMNLGATFRNIGCRRRGISNPRPRVSSRRDLGVSTLLRSNNTTRRYAAHDLRANQQISAGRITGAEQARRGGVCGE